MFDMTLVYLGWATIAALCASLLVLFVRIWVEMGKDDWHKVGINLALFTIILLLAWLARIPAL